MLTSLLQRRRFQRGWVASDLDAGDAGGRRTRPFGTGLCFNARPQEDATCFRSGGSDSVREPNGPRIEKRR